MALTSATVMHRQQNGDNLLVLSWKDAMVSVINTVYYKFFLSLEKCNDDLASQQPSCSSAKPSQVVHENVECDTEKMLNNAELSSITDLENT